MTTNESHKGLMTIDELAAQAAARLGDVDQASGRVSETPSRRTIRYYAQHGLLDRPVRFEGRTALYGERHLLQLIAIKQMQARGDSLAVIQTRLVGATDDALRRIVGVESETTAPRARREESTRRDTEFWSSAPAPVRTRAARNVDSEGPSALGGLRLDEDVLVVVENLARELHRDDLEAIRVAAQPLLRVLRARHLLNSRSD